ncbi:MAG: YkgJ family cysteine cluster protein [Acidobacteriota bacterium]
MPTRRAAGRKSGAPFYADSGLRFSCQQCHNCCRGAQPGWVFVGPRQTERMARWLKLSLADFRRRSLVRNPEGDTSLRLRPNGDCIFWDQGCTIYPVRPRQCRTFPFWSENLESREAWAEVQKTCRGAGQGRLYRLEEIRAVLHGRATVGS